MQSQGDTLFPFSFNVYLMAKPVGARCNLDCKYCYYLEKEKLYKDIPVHMMSDALLEKFTKEYIECQTTPNVLFTWHGGEALLAGIDFYKKALRFQKMYAKGRNISNSLQTNGILLNDEWCKLLHDNGFLVGVSIDGPEHCHDVYRTNKGGQGTFKQVMRGIEFMQKHKVEFNTLSVVNDYNVKYPLEIYDFFKQIGSRFMQFTPIVERVSKTAGKDLSLLSASDGESEWEMASWNVPSLGFGKFLCTIFDQWVKKDVGQYYVTTFDATLAMYVGAAPGICIWDKKCGHAGAIEFNGDVYACDHFVFPENKLGNIHSKSVFSMMLSGEQLSFGKDKYDKLPQQCKKCEFVKLCNGECPKNRILTTKDGEPGLNYLCEGYSYYFRHVLPYMEFMAGELRANRPPANVMGYAQNLCR